jgi:hypothetical protein
MGKSNTLLAPEFFADPVITSVMRKFLDDGIGFWSNG